MMPLSTPIRFLVAVLLSGSLAQCHEIPPVASPVVYLSADRNETARRPSTGCAFRYSIANTFGRLDNDRQRVAIRAGFALWQQVNPRIGFLEFLTTDRADLLVRFVEPALLQTQAIRVPVGLLGGSATVVGALRKETNGMHAIWLSNAYDWTTNALTKAIAYHAGLFLGMATATEPNALMSPLFTGGLSKVSPADSVVVNQLYASACKDLTVSYLPLSLKVSGLVTKTVKFDRQGTISVSASGQINVGTFVGICPPEGKLNGGVLNLSLADYSIVPDMFHGALLYKFANETAWRYCGKQCSFPTNNNQYVDLTFQVNDNNQTDNSGAYNVVVDYQ